MRLLVLSDSKVRTHEVGRFAASARDDKGTPQALTKCAVDARKCSRLRMPSERVNPISIFAAFQLVLSSEPSAIRAQVKFIFREFFNCYGFSLAFTPSTYSPVSICRATRGEVKWMALAPCSKLQRVQPASA
eukprot:177596-Amphidinium_carterae.1